MAIQARNYYARWRPTKHHGYVIIYWDEETKTFPEASFSNPAEFQIFVNLLRNEKPVWWEGPSQWPFASYEQSAKANRYTLRAKSA